MKLIDKEPLMAELDRAERSLINSDEAKGVRIAEFIVIEAPTIDEEKLREIVKEAVERIKEEYEIVDRPQGEWKPFDLTWGRSIYRCTACDEAVSEVPTWGGKVLFNYCPNCGARMKGADDE